MSQIDMNGSDAIEKGNEDDDDYDLTGLFVNEDYSLQTFRIQEHSTTLLCSLASSVINTLTMLTA
jgi:hypothetical protein